MTQDETPEDLGAPVAYLVLKDGTHVYDESGARAGEVEHVLSDEHTDVFHGLIIKTGDDGHRFAPADKVSGLFEHGVILTVPAADLPEPSEDPSARVADEGLQSTLKRAWNWLVQPR